MVPWKPPGVNRATLTHSAWCGPKKLKAKTSPSMLGQPYIFSQYSMHFHKVLPLSKTPLILSMSEDHLSFSSNEGHCTPLWYHPWVSRKNSLSFHCTSNSVPFPHIYLSFIHNILTCIHHLYLYICSSCKFIEGKEPYSYLHLKYNTWVFVDRDRWSRDIQSSFE